jgi:hypothetical protein
MPSNSGEPREWTMLHFSQANPKGPGQDDVEALLVRVAESIRALGAVDVHDITFHHETDDEGKGWPTMSVYYNRPEASEQQSAGLVFAPASSVYPGNMPERPPDGSWRR